MKMRSKSNVSVNIPLMSISQTVYVVNREVNVQNLPPPIFLKEILSKYLKIIKNKDDGDQ